MVYDKPRLVAAVVQRPHVQLQFGFAALPQGLLGRQGDASASSIGRRPLLDEGVRALVKATAVAFEPLVRSQHPTVGEVEERAFVSFERVVWGKRHRHVVAKEHTRPYTSLRRTAPLRSRRT